MSQEYCEYHPSKQAVDKCERCHRLICLSDKTIVRSHRSTGSDTFNRSYVAEYTFCPLCKYESSVEGKAMIERASSFGGGMNMVFILIFLVMIIFALVMFNQMNSSLFGDGTFVVVFGPILLFFGLTLAGIFFFGRFAKNMMGTTVNQNVKQARVEKDKFMNTIDNNSILKRYRQDQTLICHQCGEAIPANSLFCMNCGDSTEDERSDL